MKPEDREPLLSLEELARRQEEHFKKIARRGFVFLLGAGASAECEIPTSSKMVEKLSEDLPEQLARVFRQLRTIHQFSNIEELMLLLNAVLLPKHELMPYVQKWRIPVDDAGFRRHLTALRDTCTRRLFRWLRPRKDRDYLAHLSEFSTEGVPTSRWQHRTEVFTLNYDLTVEDACRNQGIPFTTGFGDNDTLSEGVIAWWNPSLFAGRTVSLYKLHGSVNWGELANRRTAPTKNSNEIVAIRRELFRQMYRPFSYGKDRWLRYVPRSLRPEGFYVNAFGSVRGMIFGVRDKSASYSPYIDMQLSFNEAIKKAMMLVVLGYGWQDEYLNERLRYEWQRGMFIVDVCRDAERSSTQEFRSADFFVGGGVKAALLGQTVNASYRDSLGNKATREAKGGLAGAIRYFPELLRAAKPRFGSRKYDRRLELEAYSRELEKIVDQLLRFNYSGTVLSSTRLSA